MKHDLPFFLLLMTLIVTNLIWAAAYGNLERDDELSHARLGWAEEYVNDMCVHQQKLLTLTKQ